jgi:hypothetical protein
MRVRFVCITVGFLSLILSLAAQTSVNGSASTQVPPLIQFSNVATDEGGSTLSGVVNITFSLYGTQQGGEPLWTETQNNVQLDPTGHYSVQLGITKPNGVPTTLFTTGEARWLGVQIAEQAEQPRVLLLSVPYALKAGDAATIGGLPPSAFVLAAPLNEAASGSTTASATGPSVSPETVTDVTTTGGTTGYLPFFNGTSMIIDSLLYQSGAKIGIGTTTPGATLDVKGTENVEGLLTLPATGAATSSGGRVSQGQEFVASSFNGPTTAAMNETFELRAEPVGNDTASPSATLSLLFGSGTAAPAETGLKIASNGQFTFATGQTFPGSGTVTSVASGAGLTGGPITKGGTLSIASAGITNPMLQHSSLTLTAGGGMTGGGPVSLGGTTTLGLKGCGANQVLQFVSGAWTCSNAGTGTVTSVAGGAGLTGGPITAAGTLRIATGGVTNAMLANSYAQLNTANTFTANQTVNGIFAASSSAFGVIGTATATSGLGLGVACTAATPNGYGVEGMNTSTSGGVGVYGTTSATAGYGVEGANNSTSGTGVYGTAPLFGVQGIATPTGSGAGVYGSGAIGLQGTGTAFGVFATATAAGSTGVYGFTSAV